MGSWDPKKGMEMTWTDGNVWKAEARVPVGAEVDFKVGLLEGSSTIRGAIRHSGAALEGNWSMHGDSLGVCQLRPHLEDLICSGPLTRDTHTCTSTRIQGVMIAVVMLWLTCVV